MLSFRSEDEHLKEGQIVKAEIVAPLINFKRATAEAIPCCGDISECISPQVSYALQKEPKRLICLKQYPEQVVINPLYEAQNHAFCPLQISNVYFPAYSALYFLSMPNFKMETL